MAKDVGAKKEADIAETKEQVASRQIGGNLPYTTSVGVFKRALQKIMESERPAKFNRDFLNTVLGITGGASMPIIPILRKTGMLAESGVPTPIYAEFQTEGGRANAALQALRNGFQEIFKRNQFAHKADKDKIIDLIVAITGLVKTDRIVGYIYNTFQAFQDYAKNASDSEPTQPQEQSQQKSEIQDSMSDDSGRPAIGLKYEINVILPETTNIDVFNSIFKSLRENLLK